MATNKQRRDAERLRLQRQLEQRRAREATKKRVVLVGSIVGTLAVIAAVVIGVLVVTGGDDKKDDAAAVPSNAPSASASTSEKPADCTTAKQAKGAITFAGVTIGNPTNLKAEPKVCSAGTTDPTKLEYKDLVVGTGKTPSLTSTVSVQYAGVLYKAGTAFDSSWARGGQPAQFSLQGVVPGFTQGIGGNSAAKIPPMKVGGRRIVVLPASLGYGATGSPPTIPANTALVFVIDLVKTS